MNTFQPGDRVKMKIRLLSRGTEVGALGTIENIDNCKQCEDAIVKWGEPTYVHVVLDGHDENFPYGIPYAATKTEIEHVTA